MEVYRKGKRFTNDIVLTWRPVIPRCEERGSHVHKDSSSKGRFLTDESLLGHTDPNRLPQTPLPPNVGRHSLMVHSYRGRMETERLWYPIVLVARFHRTCVLNHVSSGGQFVDVT